MAQISDHDRAELSARIKGALQEQGWKQEQLADRATAVLYSWMENPPQWATKTHREEWEAIDCFSRHLVTRLLNHPAQPISTAARRWCLAAVIEALGIGGEQREAIAKLAGGI